MRNNTPASHVWTLVGPGVWCCPFCKGFVASVALPSPEVASKLIHDTAAAAAALAAASTRVDNQTQTKD